jgi:Zn-dependent alcohol dehydrogenase
VVVGTGSVGLNVIQAAKIGGASTIIAVDTNVIRLSMAKKFGAAHALFADKGVDGLMQAAKKIKQLTDNHGADYVFECIATPGFDAAAAEMVCLTGTAMQVNGIEHEITTNLAYDSNKNTAEITEVNCRPKIDFKKIVSYYEAGAYLLEEMVTRTYQLSDLDRAFGDMLNSKNAKGVIVFD